MTGTQRILLCVSMCMFCIPGVCRGFSFFKNMKQRVIDMTEIQRIMFNVYALHASICCFILRI